MHRLLVSTCSLLAILAVVSAGSAQSPSPAASAPQAKNDYGKDESWLCRPGRQDACVVDLTTTVIAANGTLTKEKWQANPNPPIDCFYIYPTVSRDKTPNSDLNPGPEELNVIKHQFARFGSLCRLYAPLYRQVTLTALIASIADKKPTTDLFPLAYADVSDAWKYYLEHDNHGRGVVLIGHSQGARMLTSLIQREIDAKPEQQRLISALLLGTNLAVPKGKNEGGAFKAIPLCRSATQTGCAVSYASFRDNAPPPKDSRFGHVPEPDMVSACTNPAALSGGTGRLRAYLGATHSEGTSSLEPKPWVTPAKPIDTTFVSLPGLLSAACVSNESGSYLAVTVHGNPADPRTDEIVGDVVTNSTVQASWGLHLIDVNLAMGNLLDLVGKQAKAYLAKSKPKSP
jgi:hypothetical protein